MEVTVQLNHLLPVSAEKNAGLGFVLASSWLCSAIVRVRSKERRNTEWGRSGRVFCRLIVFVSDSSK